LTPAERRSHFELDSLRDRPTVHRFERDRPHDEQVERAVKQVSPIAHVFTLVD
jgi:hypothetical protein